MNNSTARIGYARVSTVDQNPDAQIAALETAGCTMIRLTRMDDEFGSNGKSSVAAICEIS